MKIHIIYNASTAAKRGAQLGLHDSRAVFAGRTKFTNSRAYHSHNPLFFGSELVYRGVKDEIPTFEQR